jgi:hypothetical protein
LKGIDTVLERMAAESGSITLGGRTAIGEKMTAELDFGHISWSSAPQ